MSNFGYPLLYSNGLNNRTQIRRSTDMVYQRGGTYGITLTGDTYISSMEMDVDLYANDNKVGRMALVPYSVQLSGATYYYYFNLRPYDYLSNYITPQPYSFYWANAAQSFYQINKVNQYPNIVKTNYRFGYRFITGGTQSVTEYAVEPQNNYTHYTDIPFCTSDTSFVASSLTNTGVYFDYVGGSFQMGTDKFVLPNFDQELGTTLTGNTLTVPSDQQKRLSPFSQYLLDYPSVPEMSETARFLTDAPRVQYIQSDENFILSFMNGQTGDRQVNEGVYVYFEFFNENNNLIASRNNTVDRLNPSALQPSPTGFTDTLQVFFLPCGPQDLKNMYGYTSLLTNAAYYTVQLCYSYPTELLTQRNFYTSFGPASEQFYFYLYENCQPENTRLCWLNARGGYDFFTFTSYRNETKKISSQTYDSRYYSTDLAGPDRDFGRTVKTFSTDLNRELVIESDYLTVEQGAWLQQLFYSPQVYEVRPDFVSPIDVTNKWYKDYRPLQVLSTDVETITKKHRKLNKYRITLKYADTFFVNRGF